MALKPYTSYVYVETWEDADPVAGEVAVKTIIPLGDEQIDPLVMEVDNGGVPEHWQDLINGLPDGYYTLKYTTSAQQDGDWEHGYYDILVVDDLISVEISLLKLPLLSFWKKRVKPTLWFIQDIFRKTWSVSYEYGGVGITHGELWFPQALALKIYTPKGYANWGDNFTVKHLSRR